MGHYPIAWLEDEDRSGAATGLAAVTDDDMIITSGDKLRLKTPHEQVALAYLWAEFAAYVPVIATMSHPLGNPLILTKGIGLNYLNEGQIYDFRSDTFKGFKAGDDMTVTGYETDEAGISHYLGLVLIVADGNIPTGPIPTPDIIHRCTVGAATEATWTPLALTEVNALPAGQYDMLGARVESATAVAARFIFPGLTTERPAVIPVTRSVDPVHPFSRFWGKAYRFTMPDGLPTLEMLAAAAETPGDVELYLKKVAVGRR